MQIGPSRRIFANNRSFCAFGQQKACCECVDGVTHRVKTGLTGWMGRYRAGYYFAPMSVGSLCYRRCARVFFGVIEVDARAGSQRATADDERYPAQCYVHGSFP